MKITILVILTLLSINSNISSQVFAGFGVKSGLVLSHLLSRRTYETGEVSGDNRFGFTAGMFGEFLKSKYYSTILEVNYAQKGDNAGGNYSSINVLSIPLFAKLSVPLSSSCIYLSAGPRADIILSTKDMETMQGLYANIKPVSYGITVSAGGEIKISKKNLIILELSFSPDFTTSTGHTGNLLDNNIVYRYTSFEFRTGIKFNR